ncbi:plexin A3-like [Spodoptera frugiperda]|uniref:Plexin A3-like n=1 Tax=Spodoptera frugiperda TaxID=7108 RepID=A0A9R0D2P3_SPOFR|nr:plexin A3-like [Spodoptera frugiperda]
MLVGIIQLILIACKILEASTSKKMQSSDLVSHDSILKTADMARIKSFVQTMNHFNDDQTPQMKDPSSYCHTFNTCHECVKSMWFPCGWCHNYGCTESPQTLCPRAETKAEKSNITGEIRACPRAEHDGPLLIPGGVRVNMKIKIYVPDPAIYEQEIICQIKLRNRLTHLKGLILNDIVYCYPIALEPHAVQFGDTDKGTLTLLWGGTQPYSNSIEIIVYNCELLASDCESCRIIPSVYGCGWCDQTAKCVIGDKCPKDMMKWTLNRLTCEHYGKPYAIRV